MQLVFRSVLSVLLGLCFLLVFLGTPKTVLSESSLLGAPIILSCLVLFGANFDGKRNLARGIVAFNVLLGIGVTNGGTSVYLGLFLSMCALILVFKAIIQPNRLLPRG